MPEMKQEIVVKGEKVVLSIEPTADTSKKQGFNVVIHINAKGKNVKMGDGYDFSYNGPFKEDIVQEIKKRQQQGIASRVEQIALYQNEYNNMAKAEALAKGKTENDAQLLKLSQEQIDGKKAWPDLKKKFPWAYDEKWSDGFKKYFDKETEYKTKCRQYLKEIQQNSSFNIMFKSKSGKSIIIEDVAMQRKIMEEQKKMTSEQMDQGTQRLVAAAEKRQSKRRSSQTEQQQKTVPLEHIMQNSGRDLG